MLVGLILAWPVWLALVTLWVSAMPWDVVAPRIEAAVAVHLELRLLHCAALGSLLATAWLAAGAAAARPCLEAVVLLCTTWWTHGRTRGRYHDLVVGAAVLITTHGVLGAVSLLHSATNAFRGACVVYLIGVAVRAIGGRHVPG